MANGEATIDWQADEFERRCLELAWRSCCAGTIGVGVVLVGPDGQVLTEGNNAIFAPADAGPLSGSRIAHAELNVFAQLPPGTSCAGATLYTSLEQCAMCAGAILMHDLAAVRVLAPDPLMHDLAAMGDRNDWVQSRWATRSFASNAMVVRFASLFAFHAAFFWFGPDHDLVAAVRAANPELAEWIALVAASNALVELAEADATLEQVIAAVEAVQTSQLAE